MSTKHPAEQMKGKAWGDELQELADRAEAVDPATATEADLAALARDAFRLLWLGWSPQLIADSARASAVAGEAVLMGRPTAGAADATRALRERLVNDREVTEAEPAAPAEPEAEPDAEEWLTIDDLAKLTHSSKEASYRRLRIVTVPAELMKKQGRRFVYKREVIELLQGVPCTYKRKPEPEAQKVRELLQPAAKERQGERTDLKPKAPDISADLRSMEAPPSQPAPPSPPTPAEQRKSTAQAAKAVESKRPTAAQRREQRRLSMQRQRATIKQQQEDAAIPVELVNQLETLLAQIKAAS